MGIIDVAIKRLSECNSSEYELRKYLEKEFSEIPEIDFHINIAIERLQDLHFLNDLRLATNLAHHYTHKGNRFIFQMLQQKGIKDDIIENALLTIEDEDVRALNEAQKKLSTCGQKMEKDKDVLQRFLSGRHFSYAVINTVVGKIDNQICCS